MQPDTTGNKLLTVAETAGMLRKGRHWVWRALRSRELPGVMIGRFYRVDLRDVLAYIEAHRTPSEPRVVRPRPKKASPVRGRGDP